MIPLSLVAEIIFVTAGGAFSPGPLTVSVFIGGAKKGWRFGLEAATGHMFFEFPLYLALGYGIYLATVIMEVKTIVALLGGVTLIAYAVLTLLSVSKGGNSSANNIKIFSSGILTGFIFTTLNPYFIVWWATAGLKLTMDIVSYDLSILPLAYPFHVWMDYFWLTVIAYLAVRGKKLGPKVMDIIQIVLAAVMVYYGYVFFMEGLSIFA